MNKKKRNALPPRAKRMKRPARLQSARAWLQKYKGNNVASAYRQHFGVDWACAFIELEKLGVKIDPDYKSAVLESVERQILARQRKKASRDEVFDQDENFAFIVGYTPAGFPYGVTWEEWEAEPSQLMANDNQRQEAGHHQSQPILQIT